jgi:hypothetical protein
MTVHVIGGGLAGLAAAVRLAATGRHVVLHEQVRQPGGRCRSFADPRLGQTLDCGVHLAFAGRSHHFSAYLAEIGATDGLIGPESTSCRFIDTRSGETWQLRPNAGAVPWWMFAPRRRIPGTGLADYVALARLALAGRGATVGDVMPSAGTGRERFWEPVCVASLNTAPSGADAQTLWAALRDALAAGGVPYRPRFVRHDLTTDFISPALQQLDRSGADLRFGHRLIGLEFTGSRLSKLVFADGHEKLSTDDAAILAVPPNAVRHLLPKLAVPRASSAIVTAHFMLRRPAAAEPQLTGLIDGRSLWLLTRGELATVTVGAANDLVPLNAQTWPSACGGR